MMAQLKRIRMQTGRAMPQPDRIALTVAVGALLVLAGCYHDRALRAKPLPALPRLLAEEIVNAKASRIGGTLRAMGSVDGTVTDADGVRRSFSLDGVMFYLSPSYLRFDLKKFGDRQLLLGSNADGYWVYSKQDETFRCGVHGLDEEVPVDFPIKPRQLLDAFGLGPIADSLRGESVGRVQRIDDQTQQILFLVRDESGGFVVEKEFWLDRFAPRLIRRVVFRDSDGSLEMESRLGDYRSFIEGGPLLPYQMEASWPRTGASLTFTIRKWSVHPSVGPTGPQFSTPKACITNGN